MNDPGELVLGVDAGGTKTAASLSPCAPPPNKIAGSGFTGPGNISYGFERATSAIRAAVEVARSKAGCGPGPFAAACLAVAGCGTEEIRQSLEEWATRIGLAKKLLIVHDAQAALACCAVEGPGIVLISGTGSIAFGRNADGETARAGGWGWLLSEAGNGHGIGVAAVRAATAATDGCGPPTALTEHMLASFRVPTVRAIISAIQSAESPPARLAQLTPLVFTTAGDGDAVAQGIIASAAESLASLAAAVMRKLRLESHAFPLGIAGGVLLHNDHLQHLLRAHLTRLGVPTQQVVQVEQPVYGAVRLAHATHDG